MTLGDSKTDREEWQAALVTDADAATGATWTFSNMGVSGQTVASAITYPVSAMLSQMPGGGESGTNAIVLLNWGVNDTNSMPTEAQWKADYLTILDAVHAKWPHAEVYLMRPWKTGKDTECDTLAGWIDDIVASRDFANLGPDERLWLKGADNGATMTSDGVHYSEAGAAECAHQWAITLGWEN